LTNAIELRHEINKSTGIVVGVAVIKVAEQIVIEKIGF
jgi:hypothetical protein